MSIFPIKMINGVSTKLVIYPNKTKKYDKCDSVIEEDWPANSPKMGPVMYRNSQ